MAAPGIQHLRHMQYLLCFFCTAEDKVMILGSVELLPKPPNLQGNGAPYHEKVTDIIIASQIFLIKVRLEMGLKMTGQFHIDLILVRINRRLRRRSR